MASDADKASGGDHAEANESRDAPDASASHADSRSDASRDDVAPPRPAVANDKKKKRPPAPVVANPSAPAQVGDLIAQVVAKSAEAMPEMPSQDDSSAKAKDKKVAPALVAPAAAAAVGVVEPSASMAAELAAAKAECARALEALHAAEKRSTPDPLAVEQALSELSAEELRLKGNDFFSQGHMKLAVRMYTNALRRGGPPSTLLGNRAMAHARLENHTKAIRDAEAAFMADQSFIKGLTLAAKSYAALGKFDEARRAYTQYLRMERPDTKSYAAAQRQLDALPKVVAAPPTWVALLDVADASQSDPQVFLPSLTLVMRDVRMVDALAASATAATFSRTLASFKGKLSENARMAPDAPANWPLHHMDNPFLASAHYKA